MAGLGTLYHELGAAGFETLQELERVFVGTEIRRVEEGVRAEHGHQGIVAEVASGRLGDGIDVGLHAGKFFLFLESSDQGGAAAEMHSLQKLAGEGAFHSVLALLGLDVYQGETASGMVLAPFGIHVQQGIPAAAGIQQALQGGGARAKYQAASVDAGQLNGTVAGIVAGGGVALFVEGGFFVLHYYQAQVPVGDEEG